MASLIHTRIHILNKNNISSKSSSVTNIEEERLEQLSKLNLVHVYKEELLKIWRGVNPRELMNERNCERLSKLGIFTYSRIRRAWLLSQDCIVELKKIDPRINK